MNEKILVIHPGYTRSGTVAFQHFLKSLNVNILAKPVENQSETIWYKLFKEHLFKKQKIQHVFFFEKKEYFPR